MSYDPPESDPPAPSPSQDGDGAPAPERPAYGDERDALPETAVFHMGPGQGLQEVSLTSKTVEEKKGTASKTHKLRLFYQERAAEILQKRLDGWTIRQLAAHFEVTQGTIHKVLTKEYGRLERNTRETMDHLKMIHRERLEFMYKALVPLIAKGNPRSIDMACKILERQSKLEGLDAPEKKQVDITVEYSDAELVQQAERLGLAVPEVLRALAQDGDVVDGEIVPPEALRDRPAQAPEAPE